MKNCIEYKVNLLLSFYYSDYFNVVLLNKTDWNWFILCNYD